MFYKDFNYIPWHQYTELCLSILSYINVHDLDTWPSDSLMSLYYLHSKPFVWDNSHLLNFFSYSLFSHVHFSRKMWLHNVSSYHACFSKTHQIDILPPSLCLCCSLQHIIFNIILIFSWLIPNHPSIPSEGDLMLLEHLEIL